MLFCGSGPAMEPLKELITGRYFPECGPRTAALIGAKPSIGDHPSCLYSGHDARVFRPATLNKRDDLHSALSDRTIGPELGPHRPLWETTRLAPLR